MLKIKMFKMLKIKICKGELLEVITFKNSRVKCGCEFAVNIFIKFL